MKRHKITIEIDVPDELTGKSADAFVDGAVNELLHWRVKRDKLDDAEMMLWAKGLHSNAARFLTASVPAEPEPDGPPWWVQESADVYTHIVRQGESEFILQLSQDSTGKSRDRVKRIATCWNALRGIADPAEFVAKAKAMAEPDIFWTDDADGENAESDPADIADRLDLGTVFRLQCAKSMPCRYYVSAVDERGCSDARPATDEEIAAFKKEEEEFKARRRAEFEAENARRRGGG